MGVVAGGLDPHTVSRRTRQAVSSISRSAADHLPDQTIRRQAERPPPEDEVEGDERKDPDGSDRRFGNGQEHDYRCRPGRPETDGHPADASAERRRLDHRHPEEEEPDGRDDESDDEQRVDDALARLPRQHEGGALLGGRPGCVVEVGFRGGHDAVSYTHLTLPTIYSV